MNNSIIYHFIDTSKQANPATAGGKGYSLIKMAQANLAIPPGFVLAVDFFKPWIDQLKQTQQWQIFLDAPNNEKQDKINAVKTLCQSLKFTFKQHEALDAALQQYSNINLFAVRSSSPEEDLASASFAGGYETILGVTPETIEHAIKQAFASCLDTRVFIYKKEQGFATNDFSIAIVIMAQIASEIAGVGFSVNPINNDCDEAVFNANWGLGETVVSGLASPDQYIVNKTTRKIIESKVGGKETSIWLLKNGGTEERADLRHNELTLTSDQVLELTEQLCRIENLYQQPMDIEWAFANNQFYLVQARPITTYIPLAPQLMTAPNEKRRLYLDLSLAVQGLDRPVSVLGSDILLNTAHIVTNNILKTKNIVNIKKGAVDVIGGRFYGNLSNIITLTSVSTLAEQFSKMDYLSGEILKDNDIDKYRADKRETALNIKPWKLIIHIPRTIIKILLGKYIPNILAIRFRINIKKFVAYIQKAESKNIPAHQNINKALLYLSHLIITHLIPPFVVGQRAGSKLKKMFSKLAKEDTEVAYHLERISRSLPYNITVEMGLQLYRMSQYLDKNKIKSLDDLLEQFNAKKLPTNFITAWNEFMGNYGFRGPEEIDIRMPRYSDKPQIILQQIYSLLTSTDKTNNPQAIFDESQREREAARVFLRKKACEIGYFNAKKFDINYRAMIYFGGYRENHKYYFIQVLGFTRKLLLKKAQEWTEQGILKNSEQIFDLTLNDIRDLEEGEDFNLNERIEKNTQLIKINARIRRFPRIIDSRGRILFTNPQILKPGELSGQAISPGIVRGKVKVLHTMDEKPLLPGEILVARATDPGWTPLFVNAAGIILEIGGMLQHGALIAREYGKPCVAGIPNVTESLQDGQLIEIDGAAGIIRTHIIE